MLRITGPRITSGSRYYIDTREVPVLFSFSVLEQIQISLVRTRKSSLSVLQAVRVYSDNPLLSKAVLAGQPAAASFRVSYF